MPRLALLRPVTGVAAVLRAAHPEDRLVLEPAERALFEALAPGRRADFAAGRRAARDALRVLGRSGAVLRDGRRPLFPEGTRGSISHCRGEVAAGVASVDPDVVGAGVDVERLGRLSSGTSELVCTPAERARGSEHDTALLTAAFSTKEAFYKAVSSPSFRASREPTFHDVELVVGERTGSAWPGAALVVAEGLLPVEHEATVELRLTGRYMWSVVLIRRTRPSDPVSSGFPLLPARSSARPDPAR